jgi:hypothetical protein
MLSDCFKQAVRFDGSIQDLESHSAEIPSGRGILLFADAQDRPIQLLIAANLRRTAKARLSGIEAETPSRRVRLAEIVRAIHFRTACCEFQAYWDCLRVSRHLFADTYRDWILLPTPHLIQIDGTEHWPRFSPTHRPDFRSPAGAQGRRVFGPYPNHKACSEVVDLQTRGFDLCRRPDLIGSPEQAQNCPYLQMDDCPAPCVGNLSRDAYLRQLDAAEKLAAGQYGAVQTDLEERMWADAGAMRFEHANRLKQVLSDIQKLRTGDGRWAGPLSESFYLHLDRAEKVKVPGKKTKVQSFAAYGFRAGQIVRFPNATLEQVDSLLESLQSLQNGNLNPDWVSSDSLSKLEDPASAAMMADSLALASFFLFRRSSGGHWFACSPSLPSREQLAEAMTEE